MTSTLIWREWDGRGLPDDQRILYTDGWADNVEGIPEAIAVEGWMTAQQARQRVDVSQLMVGWYGYRTGELVPEMCDESGESWLRDGGYVELTLRITWMTVQ